MEQQNNNFDYAISLSRIVACVFIFMCHYVQETGNAVLSASAQFFNVGVFIFFMLSGYLYGSRDIKKDGVLNFYKKRAKKIFIPLYIVAIVGIIALSIEGYFFEWYQYVALLFNLQGFFANIWGIGQVWFLTIIMICYIITPLLQKFRDEVTKRIQIILALVYVAIQVVSGLFGVTLVAKYMIYIGVYILAYFLLQRWIKSLTTMRIVAWTIVMVAAMVIRLLGKEILDGQNIYNHVIVMYTQIVLATWIILVIYYIYETWIKKLAGQTMLNVIKKIDSYTMEIYMVHMLFIQFPVAWIYRTNLAVGFVLIVISTLLSAILLKYIENKLDRGIR